MFKPRYGNLDAMVEEYKNLLYGLDDAQPKDSSLYEFVEAPTEQPIVEAVEPRPFQRTSTCNNVNLNQFRMLAGLTERVVVPWDAGVLGTTKPNSLILAEAELARPLAKYEPKGQHPIVADIGQSLDDMHQAVRSGDEEAAEKHAHKMLAHSRSLNSEHGIKHDELLQGPSKDRPPHLANMSAQRHQAAGHLETAARLAANHVSPEVGKMLGHHMKAHRAAAKFYDPEVPAKDKPGFEGVITRSTPEREADKKLSAQIAPVRKLRKIHLDRGMEKFAQAQRERKAARVGAQAKREGLPSEAHRAAQQTRAADRDPEDKEAQQLALKGKPDQGYKPHSKNPVIDLHKDVDAEHDVPLHAWEVDHIHSTAAAKTKAHVDRVRKETGRKISGGEQRDIYRNHVQQSHDAYHKMRLSNPDTVANSAKDLKASKEKLDSVAAEVARHKSELAGHEASLAKSGGESHASNAAKHKDTAAFHADVLSSLKKKRSDAESSGAPTAQLDGRIKATERELAKYTAKASAGEHMAKIAQSKADLAKATDAHSSHAAEHAKIADAHNDLVSKHKAIWKENSFQALRDAHAHKALVAASKKGFHKRVLGAFDLLGEPKSGPKASKAAKAKAYAKMAHKDSRDVRGPDETMTPAEKEAQDKAAKEHSKGVSDMTKSTRETRRARVAELAAKAQNARSEMGLKPRSAPPESTSKPGEVKHWPKNMVPPEVAAKIKPVKSIKDKTDQVVDQPNPKRPEGRAHGLPFGWDKKEKQDREPSALDPADRRPLRVPTVDADGGDQEEESIYRGFQRKDRMVEASLTGLRPGGHEDHKKEILDRFRKKIAPKSAGVSIEIEKPSPFIRSLERE